ncbi:MAG: DUF2073 domain-containing protein [Euryarchaeota archaeon]|nr:DUF2073 domain-containing protein [Euryarchaeota archaeon]
MKDDNDLLKELQQKAPGVTINLVSADRMGPMTETEKIRFILDEVEDGRILVLERGLTPMEEARLIQATMAEIDTDTFIGIEMQSYGTEPYRNVFQKLILGAPRPRMAVIGPANLLQTVRKDSNQIQAQILTKEGIAVA